MEEPPEPADIDPEWAAWLDEKCGAVARAVYELAERLLEHEDDRVTILGLIQSAVMHGLHDAGFTDETH